MFIHDKTYVEHELDDEKVLGLIFHKSSDTFSLNKVEFKLEINSKRQILQEISKVYDPLKLFCPITIKGRLLMRYVWTLEPKVDWDSELPLDVKDMYKN